MREYFNPDWFEYAFGALFTATWQACVLVTASRLASACTRGASSRSRIWTACVIGLAAAPIVALMFPHCYMAYRVPHEPLHFPSQIARPVPGSAAGVTLWTLSDGAWDDSACRMLLAVWAAGVAVSLTRLASGWFSMARLLRSTEPSHDVRVPEIIRRVVNRPAAVDVREMVGLVGAICWQIRRAMIVVPADSHRLPDRELEMMIRHEWSHLERSDPGMLFVQRLVEIIFWFHPFVWWMTLQTSKYREFVSDDAVIAAGFEPNDYAQCLGRLAIWYYAPLPLAPVGLGMLWSQNLVLERVARLFRDRPAAANPSKSRRVAVGLAAAAVVLACGVIRWDWTTSDAHGEARWTAWPKWSANVLDVIGVEVRDFPLDAHHYDPRHRPDAAGDDDLGT